MSDNPTCSQNQIVALLLHGLEANERRYAASDAVANLWREAYRALFDHGIDIHRLPSFGTYRFSYDAPHWAKTEHWAERCRQELAAEVHRYEVGFAVLVASTPEQVPKAARPAAVKRRQRKRPQQALRLVYSKPSPSPSPDRE